MQACVCLAWAGLKGGCFSASPRQHSARASANMLSSGSGDKLEGRPSRGSLSQGFFFLFFIFELQGQIDSLVCRTPGQGGLILGVLSGATVAGDAAGVSPPAAEWQRKFHLLPAFVWH